ncbi:MULTISPECIES: acyl-CoA carboxylase subunit epsilon [unclassified Streptomyces]|uniref:acyl-CoA carboxylase subunit epsilon n=1 Tax=unclassified Streptomyces TaxID=2593676 RepID=UPI0036FDE8DE
MSGIRIERGRADAEEIAAVTAVLLALGAGRTEEAAHRAPDPGGPAAAGWHRPRSVAHRGAGSWRAPR